MVRAGIFLEKAPSHSPWRELPRLGVGAVCAAALVTGLAASLSVSLGPTILAVIAGGALAIAGPSLRARLRPKAWDLLGIALVVGFALAGLAWGIAFSSMQGSDFGVYYRCGTTEAGSLARKIALCQSAYTRPSLLYWHRALLYTVPFGALAGDRPEALDGLNAALHASALLLLFGVVRRGLGSAAGVVAVLVFGLFPERLYAMTLATSDNLAIVGVIGLLAVFSLLVPSSPRRLLWLAVSAGVLLLGVELLRNTGPIFAAAMLMAAAAAPGWPARRLLAALLAVGVLVVGSTLLFAALPVSYESGGLLRQLTALDLTSDQHFVVMLRWFDHIWPAIPSGERVGFAVSKLVTELSGHVGRYPGYVLAKAAELFSGMGYAAFASGDFSANPDTVRTVASSNVPVLGSAAALHRAITSGVGAMALIGVMRGRGRPLTLAATAVSAVFFSAVLLFAEAQARYLLIPAPALAILAATSWATPVEGEPAAGPSSRFAGFATGVALLLSVAAGVFIWAKGTAANRPAPLRTAVKAAVTTPRGPCDATGALVSAGLQRVRVVLPAGVSCAGVSVTLPGDARAVRFLVVRDPVPLPFEPRTDPAVTWSAKVAGGSGLEGEFGSKTAVWIRLAFEPDGSPTRTLTFAVSRRGPASSPVALEIAHLDVQTR